MFQRWCAVIAILVAASCNASPSTPLSSTPSAAAPSVSPPRAPTGTTESPSPLGDDTPRSVADVVPPADAWPGKRVRRATAVLLFSPRLDPDAPPGPRVFQPLVCAIAGKRVTGVRCGELMPAHATIRAPQGELAVARSTQPFHDEAGDHDYPAPYGPACCMYNTCVGRTVPYRAAPGDPRAADPRTILAVWPADADLALEVAPGGLVPDISPPLATDQQVEASFRRGARSYAALRSRSSGGTLAWNLGAGWITAQAPIGPRGYTVLATTDVDHDGHLELIAHQRWANDYGLDVFGDAALALYSFSCGNI